MYAFKQMLQTRFNSEEVCISFPVEPKGWVQIVLGDPHTFYNTTTMYKLTDLGPKELCIWEDK